ncbi:hypothetical protein FSP39_010691 [Pinctada imbricata]|uniref:KY-like immunoglobulin-like domain-containing protein n=1 Tax=Pinctada imbricata TaxID=66713 RepID=A0AA88Y498_PINIB|nr:hypothetical protein FSP39_010691 [Pinctada imbricata]
MDDETVSQTAEITAQPGTEENTKFYDPEVEVATDEVGVPLEESGYPPLPPYDTGPVKSVPLNKGRPSRRRSQQQKLQTSQIQPEEIIDYDIPKSLAMKNQNMKAKDYGGLVKVLTNGLTSERQKVMCFLAWISRQEIETRKDLKGNPDTPMGYMKLIQECRGTYSAFLATICRKAGMPCVIVKGYGKTSNTKPGEQSEEELKKLSSSWNLVFVDGHWKIVHPFMVCHGTENFGIPSVNDKILQRVFQDNYIFPEGKIFSTRYIPDEHQIKWQLGVKYTFAEWKMAPCLYPPFQNLDFQFNEHSSKSAVISTETGLIRISFLTSQEKLTNKDIRFNLKAFDELNSNNDLDEYVFMTVETEPSERVTFEVRLPKISSYIFKIFVTEKSDELPKIVVSYRLDCMKLIEANIPGKLPIPSGVIGWGYGPKAVEYGLFMPSHHTGKITMKKSESLNMQFLMLQEQNITVCLYHTTLSHTEVSTFLLHSLKADRESRRRELNISVQIPIEGEFALQIGIEKDEKLVPVCNYLFCVMPKFKLDTSSRRQTPQERAAIQGLREVLGSNDIDELHTSLEYAKKHHISADDEDLKRVQMRIHLLEQKKELHDTLLRSRIDVGTNVLSKMESSEFKDVLKPEIEEVRDMVTKLKLRQSTRADEKAECNIATLAEICNLNSPRDEVVTIMRAVCLLIGHRKIDLDYWEDIRIRLMIDKRKTLALMKKTTQELTDGTSRLDAESTRRISHSLYGLSPKKVKGTVEKMATLRTEEKSTNPLETEEFSQKK